MSAACNKHRWGYQTQMGLPDTDGTMTIQVGTASVHMHPQVKLCLDFCQEQMDTEVNYQDHKGPQTGQKMSLNRTTKLQHQDHKAPISGPQSSNVRTTKDVACEFRAGAPHGFMRTLQGSHTVRANSIGTLATRWKPV